MGSKTLAPHKLPTVGALEELVRVDELALQISESV